jgi:hypothetical protein
MCLAWYYYCMKNNPFRQSVLGSFLLSPAHGMGGARVTKNVPAPPPAEKIRSVQQAGKKEGGLGEGIFARLLSLPAARLGWERFRLSASAKGQNRKIFFFLIGKKSWARAIKRIERKFFCFARRQAGGNAGWGSTQIRLRIFLEKSSDFVQSSEPNWMLLFCRLGAPRLGG